jgi:hypothetical protein
MMLAQPAQTRTQDTWQALMEQALTGLNCTVIQPPRVRFLDACFVSSSPNTRAFGAGLIPGSKLRGDLHCSRKSTPVVLEKHTFPEMPYSPGKAHPSLLSSRKNTPVVLEKHTFPEMPYFSILLEKHTLRSYHPVKAHLLSWKSTPFLKCLIFQFSWKSTPFALIIP